MAGSAQLSCPTCGAYLQGHQTVCPNCQSDVAPRGAPPSGDSGLELARAVGPTARGSEEPCFRCQSMNPANVAFCGACGASTLADVHFHGPAPAEVAYSVARRVQALGPWAPSFSDTRALLARPQGVLVGGVSREVAAQAQRILAEHRIAASVQPAAPPPVATSQGLSFVRVAVTLGLAAVAGAAGLAFWALREGAGPVGEVNAAFWKPRPQAGRSTLPAAQLKASAAAVKCTRSEGAGFFISDTLLVTNAHVVCPTGDPMYVVMSDGRRLLGTLKKMDSWLDLALLSVEGAQATPLPLADAAQAREGDKVVMVGNPHGLEFTVHNAELSFVGRNHLGLAYLQFDGTVNPGNSGGPLIDGQGRAVGVVAMKVMKAERLGLAIPVNYLFTGQTPMAQEYAPAGLDPGAWEALQRQVARQDAEEVAQVGQAFRQPGLLFARLVQGRGGVLAFLLRSPNPPRSRDVQVQVKSQGSTLCSEQVRASEWVNIASSAETSQDRFTRWALKHQLAQDLYVGVGFLSNASCFSEKGMELILPGGDVQADRVFLN